MTLEDVVCEFCREPAAELGAVLENETGQKFIVCGCSLTPEGELIPEIGNYKVIMTWGFDERGAAETLAEDVFNRILDAVDQSRGVDIYVESPDGWKIGLTLPGEGGGSSTSSSEKPTPAPQTDRSVDLRARAVDYIVDVLVRAGVTEKDMKKLKIEVHPQGILVKREKWLDKDVWNIINRALKPIGGTWDDSKIWTVPR